MSEWKEYKLGELLQTKGYVRGPFGSALKRGELLDDGIPVYEQQHAIYNRRVFRFFISEAKYEEMKRFMVQTNDIIISCSGTIGEVSIIKENDPKGIISQALLLLRVNPELVLPNYLLFFLKSKKGHDAIVSCSSGSVQVNIAKREVIESIPLLLPSIAEQNKIVAILSSLDDKIDLLRRENATLEAMAETLFRQWFVEEAKEEWEEKPLSSIATFLNGLACQKYPPKNGIDKLPVLKIRELSSGIGNDSDWATTEVGEEYIVHAGEVIFAWSASLMVKIWDGEDCILNQHLFKVTSDKYPKWFYYFWCKHHLNEFISIAQSHATTMGHIKRGDLDTAMVLVPSDNELLSMTAQMEGLLKKMENNNEQINTLVQTRDGLLEKLMSNEINL